MTVDTSLTSSCRPVFDPRMIKGPRVLWPMLLVLALVTAACGSGGTEQAGSETEAEAESSEEATAEDTASEVAAGDCAASIGVMGPFTGDAASIGQEQLNWGQFAVDSYNEENGTSIELVEGDTQLDPAQATTVAQQFVSDDAIVAVVGPAGSQEVEAVGPIFDPEDIGFVSASATATALTDGRFPTFFRVVPTDATQGPTDAEYMLTELSADNVFIIDDQTSYSTGLADAATAALEEGGATVTRDSVSQDQTDFSAVVSSVGDDVDVVFLPWQIAANAQLFAQQMTEQGKGAVIFGSDGLFSPDDFDADGAFVSAFAPDITAIESSADLVEAYTSEYGEFGTFGPPVYAATQVVLEAISAACEAGEVSRSAVTEQIAQTDQPESILGGPIVFDDNGDVEGAEFYIFEIQGGEYTLVQ